MRIRSKVEALERKASPTGACGCPENRSPDLLFCRDPAAPPPPERQCPRCRRPVPRVLVRMGGGPRTGGPPYEAIGPGGLRALVCREALPAYEAITTEGVLGLMAGEQP